MNTFTMRSVVATAVAGLTFTSLTTSASAADIDEDLIAQQICPPGTQVPDEYDEESAEYADRAEVTLYVYETSAAIDGDDETGAPTVPGQLCVFAITSTEDDTTLDGTYTLTVGSNQVTGQVTGTQSATTALGGFTDLGQIASFTASGQQTTVDIDKPTKSEKKAASKKYKAAKKKYKKKYAKAGKTAKAKRKLAKQLAAAKKKYKAATTTKKTVTKRPYSLNVSYAVDRD